MNLPLLLSSPPAGGEQPNLLFSLIPYALIIAIFYFLLIAPARKQRKQLAEMLDNLKAGDRVVTSGGIYGTVVGVTEQVIKLRIAQNVQIDVSKSAVASKQPEESS